MHRFRLKRNWSALHPRFAGIVHESIIREALEIPECPANVRDCLHSRCFDGIRSWSHRHAYVGVGESPEETAWLSSVVAQLFSRSRL